MFYIKYFTELSSTNTTSWEMINNGKAGEGTVILSGFQHMGKGQHDNSWHSEKNKNLLASIVLQPDFLHVERHFYLSMIISLAIHQVMNQKNIPAVIKWPNDIMVHHQKIAGILIENALMGQVIKHSVTGIGINVNQQTFPQELFFATSMAREMGHEIVVHELLDGLLNEVAGYYQKLKNQAFAELDRLYRGALFGVNEWNLYRDEKGIFKGSIVDIKADGRLGIKKESGEERYYYFKEVEWLRPNLA